MDIKADELVNIINACGKNGVSSVKIGEIELAFNGFVFQTESDYPVTADKVDKVVTTDPNFQNQLDLEKGLEDDEQLMLLDPAGYEEKLLSSLKI